MPRTGTGVEPFHPAAHRRPSPPALDLPPDLREKPAMNVNGRHYRTIWLEAPGCVRIIDQARLPHEFAFLDLRTPADMCAAIRNMNLRGAGLIGCAAAWGAYSNVRFNASGRGIFKNNRFHICNWSSSAVQCYLLELSAHLLYGA